jgi:hypothetical protein
MPVTIRTARPQELKEWDRILSGFPNSRVFHTEAWVRSIEGFAGARGVYLVYEKNGHIVACFPGLVSRVGPLNIFGSPREGWQTGSMGPAFDPQQITTEELASPLLPYLRRHFGVLHVEFACRDLDPQTMRRLGFIDEVLPTYVAELPSDPEDAWRGLNQKMRGNVRKARKEGLEARVELTPGFVERYYEQISFIFGRRGTAMPFTLRRVKQLFEHLEDTGWLLPVSVYLSDGETCAATGIFLVRNRELFLWGWAHRREYGSYCPVQLLTWTAMEKAIQLGCRSFDLFGPGKAKKKAGGVLDHGVVRWMYSPVPGLITGREVARWLYRRWQKVKVGLSRASRVARSSPGGTG